MVDLKLKRFNFLKGHKRSIRAKKNVILLFIINAINVTVTLSLIPLSLDLVDSYSYGVWLTILNVLSMIQVFDIGIGNGLRNNLAISIANNDVELSKQYVSTAYIVMSIVSLALILAFYIPWVLLDWAYIFNVKSSLERDLSLLIGVSFFMASIQFTLKLINVIHYAIQRPIFSSLMNCGSNILILFIFIFWKSRLEGNLVSMGLIYGIVPTCVFFCSSFIVFSKSLKSIRPSIRSIKMERTKELLSVGVQFFVIQIAVLVIFQTDSLILSHLFSPETVTPYNIVFRYFGIVTMVAGLMMTPLWSAYTEALAKNDIEWIRQVISKQLSFYKYLAVVVILLIFLSSVVLPLWVGTSLNFSTSLILFTALFTLVSNWNNIFAIFLNGIGRTRVQIFTSIMAVIVNVPLSIFLGTLLGSGGVILASTISLSFFAILGPREVFKYLKKS